MHQLVSQEYVGALAAKVQGASGRVCLTCWWLCVGWPIGGQMV